jgi:hypothetical protein
MNTKLFWKTYWDDKERLRFMAIALLILAIFLALVSKNTAFVIAVCLGYIMNDPLSYYLINYRPCQQKNKKITKRLMKAMNSDRVVEALNEVCKHEPLLEINGKPVQGAKCCRFCGLGETYWSAK